MCPQNKTQYARTYSYKDFKNVGMTDSGELGMEYGCTRKEKVAKEIEENYSSHSRFVWRVE